MNMNRKELERTRERHQKIMDRLKNFKKRELSSQQVEHELREDGGAYSRNDALTNAVARGMMIRSLDEPIKNKVGGKYEPAAF